MEHCYMFQNSIVLIFQIMNAGGRKRGKEWSEVTVDGESISCCHCHEVLSRKIERIRNHLSKCAEYKKSQVGESQPRNTNEVEVIEEFRQIPTSSKVQKIDQFISKTNDKEKANLDKQIGRAFFANNFLFLVILFTYFNSRTMKHDYFPPISFVF